jgi:hypothetical protein
MIMTHLSSYCINGQMDGEEVITNQIHLMKSIQKYSKFQNGISLLKLQTMPKGEKVNYGRYA